MAQFTAQITPSPGVAGVKPYSVPRHRAPIDLKLDANEGEAPPEQLFQRLVALGPDIMRRYPSAMELQQALATRLNLDPSQVILTAGADDALDRLCRAVLQPGKRLLLTNPSFEMLTRYAKLAGGEFDEIPWMDGPFPVDAFLERITPETALIAVVTPNNPTGTVAAREVISRLAKAAPHAIILADLAYVEFADEDYTDYCLGFPNVIVTRTFSKAWGLAGLRVGYALGPEEYIGWMRAAGGPYAVSRPSLALSLARLEADQGDSARFIAQIREDRGRLHEMLDSLGIAHTDSQANFAFAQSPQCLWIRDALAGVGISVRAYPGHPTLGNALRITCPGDRHDCDRLLHGIASAVRPEWIAVDVTSPNGADFLLALEENRPQGISRILSIEGDVSALSGRGWVVTGRRDVIEAARKGALIPLGMGDTDLEEFGAARMISNPKDLEALLP
ncbi:MAG: histidinol-phosphate aminotransferase family protein [Candidatus Sumerlaeia bacterium]|nr:histidinol-phosphate aminotransferase family protein [Candidatus Sumerlaeia bacterium]